MRDIVNHLAAQESNTHHEFVKIKDHHCVSGIPEFPVLQHVRETIPYSKITIQEHLQIISSSIPILVGSIGGVVL